MKRLLPIFLIVIVYSFSRLISASTVYAGCSFCSQTSQCADCCSGLPSCTYTCNLSVSPHVCAWSIGNQCTKWCDNGSCAYYASLGKCYKNQICCDGVHNLDTQVVQCGTGPDCTSGGGGGGGGTSTNVQGYHDGNSGTQSQPSGCIAYGWATDPNNTSQDVNIKVLDGSTQIYTGLASLYRSDLTGVCSGGTCAYNVALWNLISHNVNHTITVQAQDINSGAWVSLTNTPKLINCQSCQIQGYKTVLPGNTASSPASTQTVTLDGGSATTADPYSFNNVPIGNHTVAVTFPAGYSVGYTLCTNSTTCHSNAPTPGSSVLLTSTTCPAGGYADLWWEYSCSILYPPYLKAAVSPNNLVIFSLSPNSQNPPNPSDPSNTPYYVHICNLTQKWCQDYSTLSSQAWTFSGSPGDQFQASAYAQTSCNKSEVVTVTVTIPAPTWWQVIDSDVSTNGNLTSSVPLGQYFDVAGNGGYPGIPAYGDSFSLSGSPKLVSTKSWMANSGYSLTKIYNSTFFLNQIPPDISNSNLITITPLNWSDGSILLSGGTPDANGYYWYEYDASQYSESDLTIKNSLNLGTRKVILILKGANLIINGNITLDLINANPGFLLVVAGANGNSFKGNITVGGTVSTLQGIYVSDNQFNTSTGATKLHVTGSVVAYGRVSLQRSLPSSNLTTPAEIFEYSPALELLFPKVLSRYPMSWKEVAP